MVPKGQAKPQKNRPRKTVRAMVTRAQSRLPNRLPVVRSVAKAVRGSNSRIQLMGQPRNCHQAVPTVAVRQNHKKTTRKNI